MPERGADPLVGRDAATGRTGRENADGTARSSGLVTAGMACATSDQSSACRSVADPFRLPS